MTSHRKLWWLLGVSLFAAFFILGFYGREVYRQAPPIPERVVTTDGAVVFTNDDILTGQQVWQSTGGQQLGSIWGHGAYQAPDWSADWLHREATTILDLWATREYARPYAALNGEQQGQLRGRLVAELRTNTFDLNTGTVTISADREQAIQVTGAHYRALYGGDPGLDQLREDYAMQSVVIANAERLDKLTAFFFWTAWASTTNRPGTDVTYTNNWPHEPLVDNRPTAANVLWSMISVVLLLAGVGAIVWWQAFRAQPEPHVEAPKHDPFGLVQLTPSMRAIAKYVAVIVLLLCVQVSLGALTAHYTVEGQQFFGLPLADILPYSLTRTWHIQTGMFWIATSFLAAGLFLAPAIGGAEPRFQRFGVNVLFGALLVVVFGSLAGEWMAIQQKFTLT